MHFFIFKYKNYTSQNKNLQKHSQLMCRIFLYFFLLSSLKFSRCEETIKVNLELEDEQDEIATVKNNEANINE